MTNPDESRALAVGFSGQWKWIEATWGADPLEYHGGFRSLEFDPEARFSSSLSPNGSVFWTNVNAEFSRNQRAKTTISVAFPNVDWKFEQSVFGWAALQYQAWARGAIEVNAETRQTVALYTDRVLEFWIDGELFFGGDFYGLRRSPLVLHLDPGSHQLDIRLVRDVRAMGGGYDEHGPRIEIDLELGIPPSPLQTVTKVLLPDYVEGVLAGSLGSVSLQNTGTGMLVIRGISSRSSSYSVSMTQESSIYLRPGQVRPIAFEIEARGAFAPHVDLLVSYTILSSQDTTGVSSSISVAVQINRRSLHEPQKITFLHPGAIVSYAILRPPSEAAQEKCSRDSKTLLPVLLQLHGAGLEAEDAGVAHALDPVPDLCAWALFPTGVTPWSGDDWHNWGFADVEAAIRAIPDWIQRIGWEGPEADIEKWFVSGHSNGGQGAWYAATHRPDNVVALAPVSGYLSIQSYVPYHNWRIMDPRRQNAIQASLNNYRHELLADNLKGIPIFQQHGSADDNVPVWHSREMHQRIEEADWHSSYHERLGEGHWFDGIMTTKPLSDFYYANLPSPSKGAEQTPPQDLQSSREFSLVVASPAETGPKNGVKVLLLEFPDQLGRIDVKLQGSRCFLSTSNIVCFEIQNERCLDGLIVDGVEQDRENGEFTRLLRDSEYHWSLLGSSDDHERIRSGRQLGPMDAILRSRGAFQIRDLLGTAPEVALQISRNLHQYFGADAVITSKSENKTDNSGNTLDVFLVPSSLELSTLTAGLTQRRQQLRHDFLQLRHTRDGKYLSILGHKQAVSEICSTFRAHAYRRRPTRLYTV
ncbi:MAG: hypothetical protein M1822_009986 [Bathelium mastoideum]|nr:MAG: hypothetical protein M1822_009986 [Bathelium mastoideum]